MRQRSTGELVATTLLVFLVVLPLECCRRVYFDVQKVVVTQQLEEDDIVCVVLLEGSMIAMKDARNHFDPQSNRKIATLDLGKQTLYRAGHQVPGMPSPQYMLIDQHNYVPVYGVFSSADQVQEWAEANGYSGEFKLDLYSLREDPKRYSKEGPFALVNKPSYYKDGSHIETVIFTKRYAIWDGDVYSLEKDDEFYKLYMELMQ